MLSKIVWTVLLATMAALAVFFFLFSDSYQKSLQAKYLFTTGEYESANILAKEAFALDPYNKMAVMVMQQSGLSLEYVRYSKEALEYRNKILEITAQEVVSEADRLKVKLLCEIMIGKFHELSRQTVVTDEALVQQAKQQHDWFNEVYESVYRKGD